MASQMRRHPPFAYMITLLRSPALNRTKQYARDQVDRLIASYVGETFTQIGTWRPTLKPRPQVAHAPQAVVDLRD
jgi:hypothetical protein